MFKDANDRAGGELSILITCSSKPDCSLSPS
jgi:hypothetical protein